MPSFPSAVPRGRRKSPAARWIELAERILACGRLVRSPVGRPAGKCRLGEAQFSLLWASLGAPSAGLSQSQLAAALSLSPAHVSGLVEQLRQQGLLESRRTPSDRRRQLWRITPAGRNALEAVLADLAQWADRFHNQLGPEVSDELARLLGQLLDVLRSQPEYGGPAAPALRHFEADPGHNQTAGQSSGVRTGNLCGGNHRGVGG